MWYKVIGDEKIANKDSLVLIDFDGSINGEAIKGGKGTKYTLDLERFIKSIFDQNYSYYIYPFLLLIIYDNFCE